MGNAIIKRGGGVGIDCESATATVADVLDGKTFGGASSDDLLTGTMANNGAVSQTLSRNGRYTIPAGYHNGSGTVTQNLTYVGAQTGTLGINGTINFSTGYHNGKGKITQSIPTFAGGTYTPTASNQTVSTSGKYLSGNVTVPASSTLKAANIVKGVSIFGVSGSFINQAADHTGYTGSSFSGALASGLYTGVKFYATTGTMTGIRSFYGFNSTSASSSKTKLSGTISGSISVTNRHSAVEYTTLGFVSAKTINFSLYSSITLGVTFTVSNATRLNTAYAYLRQISTTDTTVSSTDYHTQSVAVITKSTTMSSTSVTTTLTFDVSSLTGWGYLGFNFDATNSDITTDTLTAKINSIAFVA